MLLFIFIWYFPSALPVNSEEEMEEARPIGACYLCMYERGHLTDARCLFSANSSIYIFPNEMKFNSIFPETVVGNINEIFPFARKCKKKKREKEITPSSWKLFTWKINSESEGKKEMRNDEKISIKLCKNSI